MIDKSYSPFSTFNHGIPQTDFSLQLKQLNV